mgnify:CR=1 FL=1
MLVHFYQTLRQFQVPTSIRELLDLTMARMGLAADTAGTVAVYCRSGRRSAAAADQMASAGCQWSKKRATVSGVSIGANWC